MQSLDIGLLKHLVQMVDRINLKQVLNPSCHILVKHSFAVLILDFSSKVTKTNGNVENTSLKDRL